MKFDAATHIEKCVLATNLGLRCVVYCICGCLAILYALAMFEAILTLILKLLCITVMERRC